MTDTTTHAETTVQADEKLPIIRITRDFAATAAQLVQAHIDPELYVRWVGCADMTPTIDYWDARTGGSWRFLNTMPDGDEVGFHGCFHHVGDDRLVQTFTFEGFPEAVSLETMTFEDLGDGRTRLHAQSLFDSFEARDGMLASGMQDGVNDGYDQLDTLLTDGAL